LLSEFELDSEEMDDDAGLLTSPGHVDQSMPLLVGLFETSASRRSFDTAHGHEFQGEGDYDLEEIAAKRMAGGSIIDSVANMANSILGAGKESHSVLLRSIHWLAPLFCFRNNW